MRFLSGRFALGKVFARKTVGLESLDGKPWISIRSSSSNLRLVITENWDLAMVETRRIQCGKKEWTDGRTNERKNEQTNKQKKEKERKTENKKKVEKKT